MILMREVLNVIAIFVAAIVGMSVVPSLKAKTATTPDFRADIAEHRWERKVEKVRQETVKAVSKEIEELAGDVKDASPASPCVMVQWYKRPWTYPGSIDSHLIEHGVARADLANLTHSQKERLHAALHEKELAEKPAPKIVQQMAAYRQVYQNCPGGVCPAPQYSAPRRRRR